MSVRVFLRIPSPGFPADVGTGDHHIDGFLRAVDGRLHGSAAIRRPYLFELADHLLAVKDRHVAAGMAPDLAAKQAVAEAGSAVQLSADQRSRRRRVFLVSTAGTCVLFGGLSALMLVAIRWPDPFLLWLATVLPFGFLAGHFFGYVAGAPSPVSPPASRMENEAGFRVAHGPGSRLAGLALFVGLLAVSAVAVMGVLGLGPFAEAPPSWLLALLGGAVALMPTALLVLATFEIDTDGMTYRALAGPVRIQWAQLKGVQARSGWKSLLRPPIGLTKMRLAWVDDGGIVRRRGFPVDGSMHNAERLVATVEARATTSTSDPGRAPLENTPPGSVPDGVHW